MAGCPLADIALICVMDGPAQAVAENTSGVTTRADADDVKLSARGTPAAVAREVSRAVKTRDTHAATFGAVLSRAKRTLSANTPVTGSKLLAATKGEGIRLVKEAKDLGAPSTGGGARRTATTTERLTQAAARASRLRHLPGAGAKADRLTAALVCPAALYGAPIQGICPPSLEKCGHRQQPSPDPGTPATAASGPLWPCTRTQCPAMPAP